MARTYRNLWPEFIGWDNLLLAYRRCRRRKRYRRAAWEIEFAWEPGLLQIQRELREGTYTPGGYRHFHIRDPKPRRISAAPFRDRIVHHAVVNVLEPLYERRFIHDSYACRRGKGTHRAVIRAQHFLRRHRYWLKSDIVKFFPCVDHQVLLSLISKIISDNQLMDVIRRIIASGNGVLRDETPTMWFPGDDLLAPLRPCGLPIGNLTSQFFANVLLDPVDHFIQEHVRVRGYVRYADDLLMFGDSRHVLWEAHQTLVERLAAIRLKLHPQKTHVGKSTSGVTFLGFRIFPETRRLARQTVRRFVRRRRHFQKAFRENRLNLQHARDSLKAWLAHADHANSLGIRQQLVSDFRFHRPPRTTPVNGGSGETTELRADRVPY